jgi:hypothetical protein
MNINDILQSLEGEELSLLVKYSSSSFDIDSERVASQRSTKIGRQFCNKRTKAFS